MCTAAPLSGAMRWLTWVHSAFCTHLHPYAPFCSVKACPFESPCGPSRPPLAGALFFGGDGGPGGVQVSVGRPGQVA